MATHDYVIANASGAAVRADLNNALAAIVSNNSNATEPATTYAYMWWADTTNGQLKLRNAANDAWITIQELDGTMLLEDGSAAAPGLAFTSDLNTGLYLAAANSLGFATDGTGRLTIDSSGRVGVGTASPATALHVSGSGTQRVRITGTGSANAILTLDAPSGFVNYIEYGASASTPLAFYDVANTAERARIDSSGRLLVGTSSAVSADTWNLIQAVDSVGGYLVAARNDTSVVDGDAIGGLRFYGNDSDGNYDECARVECNADGTHTDTSKPSRLRFLTTADGASSPTERMRISKDGSIRINTGGVNPSASVNGTLISETGYIWTSVGGDPAAYFNRNTNDGAIVELRQANVTEGTISVSGTTVSYNGAHLSRWSQLPSGAERTEILRGSVLSNIDEMCEWGEEENEQLNRMKVSDVEGDKNVSGVFQAWDDDDDTYTNDFYCAMTGDFIIRIGAGVTVERGDLLMSAGDGTAKPQDDDIIRSKTIAKVTSTNVSCTYDDGSYCVPCVLMAC